MRVAIVNDMALATEVLRRVVCSDPGHVIAWTAADGRQALDCCRRDTPDVILMDLVMPVMNGAEATREIMQACPCAILVVTATVSGNFSLVCQALGYGAFDAVCTPSLGAGTPAQAGAQLLAKLSQVDRINRRLGRGDSSLGLAAVRPEPSGTAVTGLPAAANPPSAQAPFSPQAALPLVLIGSSTGGPPALQAILSRWRPDFPAAVVIAQHIGADFASPLAQWLQQTCRLSVGLAQPGQALRAGTVSIAGTNDHLVVSPNATLHYTSHPIDYPYRPSVDALFQSAVSWPRPGIAVLLTGLGRDGAQGMLQLKQAGWYTIAQDAATSVVYGMPQAAAQLDAARRILPIGEIGDHVELQLKRLVAG